VRRMMLAAAPKNGAGRCGMKLSSCKTTAHAREARRAVSPEETRDHVRSLSFAGACGVDRKSEGAGENGSYVDA